MMQTTAAKSGNHWVINGRKAFITGADGAKVGIVMAKSAEGACMFLVDLPDPAIRIERVLDTIDCSMPGGHAVVDDRQSARAGRPDARRERRRLQICAGAPEPGAAVALHALAWRGDAGAGDRHRLCLQAPRRSASC